MSVSITPVPCLEDNYAWLIESGGITAIVDPAEPEPVIAALGGRKLDLILNTHHHSDHTDGNLALKKRYGATVIGPAAEAARIPGIDRGVAQGDTIDLNGHSITIIETPGHTAGHICFYMADQHVLFSGDTLFSLGSGRLFEGNPEQMWDSLKKIAALPDDTHVFCGHEYTIDFAAFGLSVEPDNNDIKDVLSRAQDLRARKLPTLPTTLSQEKKANVFLRAGSVERYAQIRKLCDNF